MQVPTLKPWVILVQEAVRLYGKGFLPFFSTALLMALISNVGSTFWKADDYWTTVGIAMAMTIPNLLGQAAIIVMALDAQQGKPATIVPAIARSLRFLVHYVPGSMLILLPVALGTTIVQRMPADATQVPPDTLPRLLAAMILGLYLSARFALFGPAVIAEGRNIVSGLATSWQLTAGRVWRTMAFVVLTSFMSTLIVAIVAIMGRSLGESEGAKIITVALAQGLITPFVTIFMLLLFQDYRAIPHAARHRSPPTL